MVINTSCMAGAPSRRSAEAPSRPTAAAAPRRPDGSCLGAVARKRGLAVPAAGSGYLAGIGIGGGNAAAGYPLGLGGAFRSGPFAGNPIVVTKSTVQHSTAQNGTAQNSTVQNSNDKHNSIQMTRLVPASWGALGPHREKEPGSA